MAPLPPLATVQQLSDYMRDFDVPAGDPSGVVALQTASGHVRAYLGQTITRVLGDVTVLDPILGTPAVLLPELPIGVVSQLETYGPGPDGRTYGWRTAVAGTWNFSAATGMVVGQPVYWSGTRWPAGPGTWRVTYDHGYTDVPDGIIGVTLSLAARTYSTPSGVQAETLGGYVVHYDAKNADTFSAPEQGTLNRYRVLSTQ